MGKQFQLLRGFAILLVLVNHSIMMSLWMGERLGLPKPGVFAADILALLRIIGVISVPIFLFLSGAFFSFASQNRPFKSAYQAVLKNLLMVFWPYLIWSAVFYLVVALLLGEYYSFFGYIKNVIIGYPYHFVPLLILYYVLAPVIVWISQRRPILMISVILAYQLFLANVLQPGILGFTFPSWTYHFSPPIVRETLSKWAVFFPFGILYHQYSRVLTEKFQKFVPLLVLSSVVMFVLCFLDNIQIINFPISLILSPIFTITLVPFIRRDIVPFYRWVEDLGKKAYGLYLTNLTIYTLALFAIQAIFPWLLGHYFLLFPVLSMLGLYIPLGIMRLFEMPSNRSLYRYVFG